jgi:hypothetical protein
VVDVDGSVPLVLEPGSGSLLALEDGWASRVDELGASGSASGADASEDDGGGSARVGAAPGASTA